ncbi:hypothetical protein F4805DRAFT_440813 [Annulohypoxylon moriforme]|nr:hypothetical protein F4805DRAFT_440813 [Annulohypoxylon moriforme]
MSLILIITFWCGSRMISENTYEDNTDANLIGSFYPVAIDVESLSLTSRAIYVRVDVDDQILGVPFSLYGGNDATDNVAGSDPSQPLIFYESGEQRIRVTVSPPWASNNTPWAVIGNIHWRLKITPTNQIIGITSTRLEFYAITKSLPLFYKNVVGVKLLRRFVVPLRDTSHSTSWVSHCCNLTFTNFSFLYDSYYGAASYTSSYAGGSFKLASYLSDIGTKTMLNSYDQAAIMQICLGLSPVTKGVGYVFMRKFGWIVTTSLVGRGQCNNPYYLNNKFNRSIICDNDASDRSSFGNHAFISLNPNSKDAIVDSSIGPYNGSLDLQAYINASIQTTNDTTLYRATSTTPGTASDADFGQSGVTDLNGTTVTAQTDQAAEPSLLLPGTPPYLKGVQHMIDLATAPPPDVGERRSNAAIAEFFNNDIISSLSSLDFSVKDSSIVASYNGTDAEWVLGSSDNNDDIIVKLFIAAQGPIEAAAAFANHLETYSRALDGLFRAPDQRRVRGQLNLESVGVSDGKEGSNSILLWVYGNVFVRIAHRFDGPHRNGQRIQDLADALHTHISKGSKPIDSNELTIPKIRKLSGPEGSVAIGKSFVIHVSLEGKSYTTVNCKAGVSSHIS